MTEIKKIDYSFCKYLKAFLKNYEELPKEEESTGDKILLKEFSKIVKNINQNGYLLSNTKKLKAIINKINSNQINKYYNNILIMNYIYLANKYHDKFLKTNIQYQTDLLNALSNTDYSITKYDQMASILLDNGVIKAYSKIEYGVGKYHLLETILDIIEDHGNKEQKKKQVYDFLSSFNQDIKPKLEEDFSLKNLYNFVRSQIDIAMDLNIINEDTENIEPETILLLEKCPEDIQKLYLKECEEVYRSPIGILDKLLLYTSRAEMIANSYVPSKIISFDSFSKGQKK